MRVTAVSISRRKGEKKTNMDQIRLVENHGAAGDAHAGPWHRQVSLLGRESIDKMVRMGLAVGPGDFAENITTEGLELFSLPVGSRVEIGPSAVLELTQIGKACHGGCEIMRAVGSCVMPREGVFFRVIRGGTVRPGDRLAVLDSPAA
jgi:MOSC domain-containing protein YiiM